MQVTSLREKTDIEHTYVPKGWGSELWVVNKEEYCGKILTFENGRKCSWHYHKIKDEVFHLMSGKLKVFYSDDDDLSKAKWKILNPGDSFYVYPGLRHRMLALEDSVMIEFSTQHFDSDSYRVEKGD
jgi:quercetin dioxygenase-like cupin family protein